MHHASIRTADIHQAIAFYEQLGFQIQERFTAGITLACWMEGMGGRIELVQVPQPRPAADAFADEHYTGYYHLSFDLTPLITDLSEWLAKLQQKFEIAAASGQVQPLKVLLPPTQQQIGTHIYEVTFVADADSLPLEFIRMMINPNESR
ncbi:MAG: VOC family protein [Leptolyngbyaceae cyanobacterium CSU_1_4]|nr:VOC family protein [Leptolyngbyaceae cyanobacterium CSU_1_4]